ncbi:GMC family oxidoreductase [Kitasatospora sp. CM 4170]|uniref:GMC family oxidoreductase n=1 Tax=Kitasatospora aburaviensis TaxID=67265 RepID=A0ABW1EX11_9ACTN|nr:GMC family oxidoreductase [Kitasatospora sp. CM 4170]WNM43829.1 GMC family oxidoreductase [Kitasatospora sp. CM 4170]
MSPHWDAVVVGAGFAGSLVAERLGAQGWRVLVLEAGPPVPGAAATASAFRAGGAPFSPYPHSPDAPSPGPGDLTGHPDGGFTATGHLTQYGPLPYASGYLRVNGGTGMLWTGLTPRMHPEDFRTGDLGHGRNWPIGYDDLEPYYRQAEQELGVAADADQQRAAVGLPLPAGYAFPMRAIAPSHLDRQVARALDGRTVRDPAQAEEARLAVVATPHARNGLPTRPGGPIGPADVAAPTGAPCAGSASCVPVCPTGAKYTPLRTQARWAATVELRTDAVVTRVLADGAGRISGVEFRSGGAAHRVSVDLVVLAAHAIENARLLLLSGLANRSGQVGRNLMDHPALLTWGLMPRPVGPYRGPGSTSGLEAFRFGPARARRAPFRIEIGNWGWSWAAGPPQVEVAALLAAGIRGKELRDRLGDRLGRQFSLQFELEQPADPANRVVLDHDRPDPLGLPSPAVHYDLSAYVRRGMASARAVSDQLFDLLGAEDHTRYEAGPRWPGRLEHDGRAYAYRGAGHAGGTHLMGDAPGTSVVDQWQRCWDHPNLYAVGCGSMPSLGTSNPSLTMAALALRSADRIHLDLLARHRPAVLGAGTGRAATSSTES